MSLTPPYPDTILAPLTGMFDTDWSPCNWSPGAMVHDGKATPAHAQPVPLCAGESARFALLDNIDLADMRAEVEPEYCVHTPLPAGPMSPSLRELVGRCGGIDGDADEDDLSCDVASWFENGYEAPHSGDAGAPGACSEEHAEFSADGEATSADDDAEASSPRAVDSDCDDDGAFDFVAGREGRQFFVELEPEAPAVQCPPVTPHAGSSEPTHEECPSEASSPAAVVSAPPSPDHVARDVLQPLDIAPLSPVQEPSSHMPMTPLSAMAADLFDGGDDSHMDFSFAGVVAGAEEEPHDQLSIAPGEAVAASDEYTDEVLDSGVLPARFAFRAEILPPGARRRSNAAAAERIQTAAEHDALSRRRIHPPTMVSVGPASRKRTSSVATPPAQRARHHAEQLSPAQSPQPDPTPVPLVIDVPSDSEPESQLPVRGRSRRSIDRRRRRSASPPPPPNPPLPRSLSPVAPSKVGVLRVQKNKDGRVVRHQVAHPKPALLFGIVEPKQGQYPPPPINKKGSSGPRYRDEYNETLGYVFRTRPNACDFANTLVTNAKNQFDLKPCEKNQLLLDWRRAMAADFANEIANIRRLWQAKYNKLNDAPPSFKTCARDITLIFRWLCDCYGETETSVGLPD